MPGWFRDNRDFGNISDGLRVLRRRLGVGNSTGLGMAPFLIRHPRLLNNWIQVSETALASGRSLPAVAPDTVDGFLDALAAASETKRLWQSTHPVQIVRLTC